MRCYPPMCLSLKALSLKKEMTLTCHPCASSSPKRPLFFPRNFVQIEKKKNWPFVQDFTHSWQPDQGSSFLWLQDIGTFQASASIEVAHAVSLHVFPSLDPLHVLYSISTAKTVGSNIVPLATYELTSMECLCSQVSLSQVKHR